MTEAQGGGRRGAATVDHLNPGTPYGTYMSHVFFLQLLHEYNKKKYFKLSPILL